MNLKKKIADLVEQSASDDTPDSFYEAQWQEAVNDPNVNEIGDVVLMVVGIRASILMRLLSNEQTAAVAAGLISMALMTAGIAIPPEQLASALNTIATQGLKAQQAYRASKGWHSAAKEGQDATQTRATATQGGERRPRAEDEPGGATATQGGVRRYPVQQELSKGEKLLIGGGLVLLGLALSRGGK